MQLWWPRHGFLRLLRDGLARFDEQYRHRPDGSRFWSAERPGPGWRRHGTTPRTVRDVRDGAIVEVVVHQQRWFHPTHHLTRTDQAPDLVAWGRFSTLVMFSAIMEQLYPEPGCQTADTAACSGYRPAQRTVQRWVRHALDHALALQQGVRNAWFAIGPRQGRDEIPGGIPPPPPPGARQLLPGVDPLSVAVSMVLGFAIGTNMAVAPLLAEVRRRLPPITHAR